MDNDTVKWFSFNEETNFCVNTFQELMANTINKHNLPFNFVEYQGIRDIFKYLSIDIQSVYWNTLKSDILHIFNKEKKKIKEIIHASDSQICLT